VRDFRDLKMFVRQGRRHVEEWLGFLQGHAQLFAIVPIFQPGLPLEENVKALRDAGKVDKKATGIRWCQGDYLYCGNVGLLLLVAQEKDRKAFVVYLDSLREKYNQRAYALWSGTKTVLVTAEGQAELPAFTGSLDSLDELAGHLMPGWHTQGNFDRSISYVQMRDHQTRPRPEQSGPTTPGGSEP
jgi:hypothetical protein